MIATLVQKRYHIRPVSRPDSCDKRDAIISAPSDQGADMVLEAL